LEKLLQKRSEIGSTNRVSHNCHDPEQLVGAGDRLERSCRPAASRFDRQGLPGDERERAASCLEPANFQSCRKPRQSLPRSDQGKDLLSRHRQLHRCRCPRTIAQGAGHRGISGDAAVPLRSQRAILTEMRFDLAGQRQNNPCTHQCALRTGRYRSATKSLAARYLRDTMTVSEGYAHGCEMFAIGSVRFTGSDGRFRAGGERFRFRSRHCWNDNCCRCPIDLRTKSHRGQNCCRRQLMNCVTRTNCENSLSKCTRNQGADFIVFQINCVDCP
jgi:hypothetical protein